MKFAAEVFLTPSSFSTRNLRFRVPNKYLGAEGVPRPKPPLALNLFWLESIMRLPILEKLEKELETTKVELKVEIPKALKTAREHGDLSENAEFKAAKERQMFLETRMSQLQKRISDITSLNIDRLPKDRSGLGSTLFLKDLQTGQETTYHLVFPEEVNPEEGKISTASPLGKALMGKQAGDELIFPQPDRPKEFEVLRVVTIHDDMENREPRS